MKNTAFYGYKESQASYGYKSAVLYKQEGESKYRFLCASETVPFPFGSKETTEFNLMNSPVIGQVEGKDTLEQKEVELLYTRNNALLFEKLKGKVLEFMSMTPQLIGYKFSGTISFRPNDASSELHKGTYVITPMDADPTPHFMARIEALQPIFFTDSVPDEISVTEATSGKLKLGLATNLENATFKYDTIDATTNKETGTPKDLTVTSGVAELAVEANKMYVIYANPPTGNTTHSGCFTTVYVTE